MRHFWIVFFSAMGFWASAQGEGMLRLYLHPPAEIVLIDGEELKYGNKAQLQAGKHRLQAWASNMEVLDTVVELKDGETLDFFYRFENNQAFYQGQDKLKAYNKKFNTKITVPAIGSALAGGALIFTYIKGKQLEEDVRQKHLLYKYAGYDFEDRKEDFLQAQDQYKSYYYAQFVEYGVLAVSGFFFAKGIRWLLNNPRPKIKEDQNPFKISGLGVAPNTQGGFSAGISLNFN